VSFNRKSVCTFTFQVQMSENYSARLLVDSHVFVKDWLQVTTKCTSFSSLGREVLTTNAESSRVSCKKILLYTGIPRLKQLLHSGRSDASWDLCKVEQSILHMYVTCSPVEFQLQHTWDCTLSTQHFAVKHTPTRCVSSLGYEMNFTNS
jgi:hypothetical protein